MVIPGVVGNCLPVGGNVVKQEKSTRGQEVQALWQLIPGLLESPKTLTHVAGNHPIWNWEVGVGKHLNDIYL